MTLEPQMLNDRARVGVGPYFYLFSNMYVFMLPAGMVHAPSGPRIYLFRDGPAPDTGHGDVE